MTKTMRMKSTVKVPRMGDKKKVYMILEGIPGGKRLLGKPRCRQMDNIKMYIRDIGWGGMDLTDLAQDRETP